MHGGYIAGLAVRIAHAATGGHPAPPKISLANAVGLGLDLGYILPDFSIFESDSPKPAHPPQEVKNTDSAATQTDIVISTNPVDGSTQTDGGHGADTSTHTDTIITSNPVDGSMQTDVGPGADASTQTDPIMSPKPIDGSTQTGPSVPMDVIHPPKDWSDIRPDYKDIWDYPEDADKGQSKEGILDKIKNIVTGTPKKESVPLDTFSKISFDEEKDKAAPIHRKRADPLTAALISKVASEIDNLPLRVQQIRNEVLWWLNWNGPRSYGGEQGTGFAGMPDPGQTSGKCTYLGAGIPDENKIREDILRDAMGQNVFFTLTSMSVVLDNLMRGNIEDGIASSNLAHLMARPGWLASNMERDYSSDLQ
jgi:hypothetical protein